MYSNMKTPEMTWTDFAQSRLGFALPNRGGTGMYHIPVWILVVIVGLPTVILWWRDRRPKEGCCKTCKYDLTGNISGICPECGTAIVGTTKTNDATTPTGGA